MKSALFVCGGWEGHEPEKCAAVFAPILEESGYEVEISTTLDTYLDREKMRSLDLVIPIWTMGEITDQQEEGLRMAVESGVGLAGWHGGMADSFRASTEYQFMVGGQWVAHPGNIIDYTVDVTKPDDPIMAGIGPKGTRWPFKDEWYNLVPYPTNVKYLATVDESTLATRREIHPGHGKFHPVAWCHYYNGGRVFVTTMGHDAAAFADPAGIPAPTFPGHAQFQSMITNGILATMGNIPFCT